MNQKEIISNLDLLFTKNESKPNSLPKNDNKLKKQNSFKPLKDENVEKKKNKCNKPETVSKNAIVQTAIIKTVIPKNEEGKVITQSTVQPAKRQKIDVPVINQITSKTDLAFLDYLYKELPLNIKTLINGNIKTPSAKETISSVIKLSSQGLKELENNRTKTVALSNTPGKHLTITEVENKNRLNLYISKHLSNKICKRMNLYSVKESDIHYIDFNELHEMWLNYIIPLLSSSTNSTLLDLCEFEGGKIKIIRSKNPTHINLEGYILKENLNSFLLITTQSKLKTIIKKENIFELLIKDHKSILFSGSLLHDRSCSLLSLQPSKSHHKPNQKRCTHPKLTFY